MTLSPQTFSSEFARFKAKVHRHSGVAFKSFRDGLPDEWEGYKPRLRDHAIAHMGAAGWRAEDVGTGLILDAVIKAIEIDEGDLRNNLVAWQNRYGHASRSHSKLLDAVGDSEKLKGLEELFRDFFQDRLADSDAFEELQGWTGKRYDILAYFFFLRDPERFMPIATTTFDKAFKLLEIELTTAHKCSWDNYTRYNHALSSVRDALVEEAGIADACLLDAHSFCWMLIRLKDEVSAPEKAARRKAKKDPGRVFDARQKSVWQMAQTAEQTAKSSLGPAVEKTPKRKEVRMSRQRLEQYIEELLRKQEERCALTGIQLQWLGEGTDDQLLASLDRIDSDGHYEEDNLQVVCRFINFWKQASDNEEFLRLLSLVRRVDTGA